MLIRGMVISMRPGGYEMEYVDVGLFFDPEDQGVMKIVSQRINVMHPPPPFLLSIRLYLYHFLTCLHHTVNQVSLVTIITITSHCNTLQPAEFYLIR